MGLPAARGNDLVLVCHHEGQVSVWVGWKRALAAFADPRLWEGSAHWGDYFQRQPEGTGWGMAGYGLVVVDVDTRTAWSVNDHATPGTIHLPSTAEAALYNGPAGSDETGARRALGQLLTRPELWGCTAFTVARRSLASALMGRRRAPEKRSLADLVSPAAGVEKNQALMVLNGGELSIAGKRYLVFTGAYQPSQWSVHSTAGRADLEVLERLIEHARSTGFPPPAAELIVPWVKEQTDLGEDAPQDVLATRARFQALLDGWGESPPPLRSVKRQPPG